VDNYVQVALRPDVYPTRAVTESTSQSVKVSNGSPVTLHLTGSQVAAASDTALAWYVETDYMTKFERQDFLKSPLVLRHSSSEAVPGSSFTGTTDWTCSTQALPYAESRGTVTATLCLRQSGAAVQAKGSAGYVGPNEYWPRVVRYSIAVNGVPDTAAGEILVDLGGNGTFTLPSVTTYALRGDLTAAPTIKLGLDALPVVLRPLVVQ
jgi:hypothetical protein